MVQFIKKILKFILLKFKFEIHSICNNNQGRISRLDCLKHISKLGFNPNTVIDVGVADGTFDLYNTFYQSNFLLIEPLKEWEECLKKICCKFKAEYILAAAGDKTGEIVINVHDHPSSSSILEESDGKRIDGTPRKVPIVKVDDLCAEKHLKGPFLLKIDVQGAEINVLEGSTNTLNDTEVVILEVQFFQFLKNCPQIYDIISYMKNKGFVVYDIFDYIYRPLDNALAAVDMAFVKENGYFRKLHFFRNPKSIRTSI